MLLADCYHLLEIDPGSSLDEVKRAHRDLTKVWHPDRFGNDPALRAKAEEKLKAINEAFETIRDSHGASEQARPPGAEPRADTGVLRHGGDLVWSVMFALLGFFFLVRRPGVAGLLIALVLFAVAWAMFPRERR